ncbi:MAG: hypothetical protein RSD41_04170, partial [Kiritimatiellia bacterium]
TLEHPATLLLFLTSAAGTLLLPLFQFQRFSEDGRLARDCGLATAFLFGFFLLVGGACRITRSLEDGTAATAFVKSLPRGLWFCGVVCGLSAVAVVYGVLQGAAVMLAEAYSPQYHSGGSYGEGWGGLFFSLGLLPLALILAALNHRFREGRFALSATLLMALFLGLRTLWVEVHWGDLTALLAIGFALLQVTAFAAAVAVRGKPGLTVGLSVTLTGGAFLFLNGSAYLPLDALAEGGQVPLRTLLLLLPQTICATAFFLWAGIQLLNSREVA